jgi:RNA polymerase sigma factor (sigma-70 family)
MSASLLTRIASGDQEAVDDFLAQYGGLVWSLVLRQIPNRAEAEEVIQEIFLDLWRHAARFDEQVATEVTFVAMISRRRLIDHRRKRQRAITTTSMPANLEPAAADDQNSYGIGADVEFAREQLAQLRPAERQVLEMAIDGGLSQSQIAEVLGIPLGTVKTTARRGLTRLRELVLERPPQPAVEGGRS